MHGDCLDRPFSWDRILRISEVPCGQIAMNASNGVVRTSNLCSMMNGRLLGDESRGDAGHGVERRVQVGQADEWCCYHASHRELRNEWQVRN